MNRKPSLLPTFLLCSLLAAVLTFLGLRLYYHSTRLSAVLTTTYPAEQFVIRAGQGRYADGVLKLTHTNARQQSHADLDNLYIDTRFYESVRVVFEEKDALLPLQLQLQYQQAGEKTQPILYTDNMTSRLFFNHSGVITGMRLSADKLFIPYSVRSVTFEARQLSTFAFGQLLLNHLGRSLQPADEQVQLPLSQYLLLSSKLLILLYFLVFGALITIALILKKRRLMPAWWVLLMCAWFVLDTFYLIGKSQQQWRAAFEPATAKAAQVNFLPSANDENQPSDNVPLDAGFAVDATQSVGEVDEMLTEPTADELIANGTVEPASKTGDAPTDGDIAQVTDENADKPADDGSGDNGDEAEQSPVSEPATTLPTETQATEDKP